MRRAVFLAVLLLMSLAAPVSAAAINDTPGTAIEIGVGTTVTEDTTLADETDAAETALNDFCGAPVVEHGVWFEVTAPEDTFASFDATDSDYSAGLMLFTPTATGENLINCGPGRIVDQLLAGETYLLMVFGDGGSPETSGEMVLRVEEAVPPPEIDLTINKTGTVDRQGNALISGTVTCTSEDGSGILFDVFGDVSQRVGRVIIRGFFDTLLETPCDGTTQPWQAIVFADNGLFAGGKAATLAIAFGCTDVCSEQFAEATIQLRRSRG
jgi:hypothetical protein